MKPVLFLDFDDVICMNKTCGNFTDFQTMERSVKKGLW